MDDGALPDAAAAALAAGTSPTTTQWARHRRAAGGALGDPALGLPTGAAGTPGAHGLPGPTTGAAEAGSDAQPTEPISAANADPAALATTNVWPGLPLPLPMPAQPPLTPGDASTLAAPAADGTAAAGVQSLARLPTAVAMPSATPPAPEQAAPGTPLQPAAQVETLAAGAATAPTLVTGPSVATPPVATPPVAMAAAQPVQASSASTLPLAATPAASAQPAAAVAAVSAQGPAPVPVAITRGPLADTIVRPAGRSSQAPGAGVPAGATATATVAAGTARPAIRQPAGTGVPADPAQAADPAMGTDTAAGTLATAATATASTTAAAAPQPATAQPLPPGQLAVAAPLAPATDTTGQRTGAGRADESAATVRPVGARTMQNSQLEPVAAGLPQRTRTAAPADAPRAEPARPAQEAAAAAAPGPLPAPPQPGPANPPPTNAERALQALGAAAQAAARAEPVPQADTSTSFQALPQAAAAAGGLAGASGSGATSPLPTEARVPVPLDDPAFGAALGTQVSVLVRDGVQTARLQLNPAEMGPIAVQIALDGSAARVDFQADLAGTRAVIEASLPALAGALQEAGFTLAGGGVFQQTPGRQGQGDAPAQPGQTGGADGNTRLADLPAAAVPVRTQRGLVDLVA